MRKPLVVVLAAMFAAGCSSGESSNENNNAGSSPSQSPVSFHTQAGPGPANAIQETGAHLKFSDPDVSASGREIAIHFENGEHPSKAEIKHFAPLYPWKHDFTITSSTGEVLAKTDILKTGQDTVLVVDGLSSGTYTFYCSIHVREGMKGTLTVTAA